MAKSNQTLTAELERLQAIVGQNADLLNQFMLELKTSLKEVDGRQIASAAKTKEIDDKLEEHLTPLVSADLISKQIKTDSKSEELFKMFTELKSTEAQHKVELDKVTSQTTTQDETMAPMKATFANIEAAMRQPKVEVKESQDKSRESTRSARPGTRQRRANSLSFHNRGADHLPLDHERQNRLPRTSSPWSRRRSRVMKTSPW